MVNVAYLDTSALLKQYVTETGSSWIEAYLVASPAPIVFTSLLTTIEATRAFTRRLRDGTLTPLVYATVVKAFDYDIAHRYNLLDVMPVTLETARRLATQHPLRAYDALQLATAWSLNQNLLNSEQMAGTARSMNWTCARSMNGSGGIVSTNAYARPGQSYSRRRPSVVFRRLCAACSTTSKKENQGQKRKANRIERYTGGLSMGEMIELKKSVPVVADVDVLVVGAGIAGSTAVVTAARYGAKTMVVDRFGYPGGNMGPGMIGGALNLELPDSMAKGLPGIPGEFVRRCEAYGNAPLLNHYFRDTQVISYVWLKMMQESGVQCLFNTYAADPIMEGNRVVGLTVETKAGTQAIRAKVVIDATGDADVAARAGAPVDDGHGYFHAGMYFAMANVDIETYEARVALCEPDPDDQRWAESVERPVGRRFGRLRPLLSYLRAAWEAGEYRYLKTVGDLGTIAFDHGIFRSVSGVQYVADPLRVGRYGILGALVGVHGTEKALSGDKAEMTALGVASRSDIFETAQFLIRRVPGFEKAYLHIAAPYFHSRGGRSIISEHPVTRDEARTGRRFDDVVFLADDPEHRVGREGEESRGEQRAYDFPYRQFLPRGVEGLLVTGRAAIIQPPCMRVRWMVFLMGQAVGAAAALAAKAGKTPRALDVKELQKRLYEKHQVFLGDEKRLRELGIV
jgi:predicted nucleic acid-binding protein